MSASHINSSRLNNLGNQDWALNNKQQIVSDSVLLNELLILVEVVVGFTTLTLSVYCYFA